MKLILSILIIITTSVFAQHSFVVNFSQTVGIIKDLTDVNKGEMAVYSSGYKDANISLVRLHDYHGANDYCFYSTFWNYNNSTKSYSINKNFNPDSSSYYNWIDYDNTIQELKENNISPYIRLGSSYPNSKYQSQPYAAPLDSDGISFTKFAKLCKKTVMHTNEGWDNGTFHNVKYWEIWNEPGGLFWDGTPIQFYRMFEAVADTLKSNFSDIKIGGPGAHPSTTLEVFPTYGNNFLNYLKDNNVPLDFYSWHIYGIKNPYSLFEIAEGIRAKLDGYGLTDTESHISEINHALTEEEFHYFDYDAKGTAYYASLIIAAQKSSVDKVFWYPGKAFFESDGYNYSWLGHSVKAYSLIRKEAPIEIFSSGDMVVEGNRTVDTTNVMMLASKSEDDEKVYLFLSNYNSKVSNFEITINNLPWQSTDSISVVRNITKNPEIRFTEFTRVIKGNNKLKLNVRNMPAPSVVLIRLEKKSTTDITQELSGFPKRFELKQNYPNPFNPSTIISYSIPKTGNVTLQVYNALGQEVASLVNKTQSAGNYKIEFDASKLSSGIYIYTLKSLGFLQSNKMVLLR